MLRPIVEDIRMADVVMSGGQTLGALIMGRVFIALIYGIAFDIILR